MKRQYDTGPSGGGKRPVRCAAVCGAVIVPFVQFNSACSDCQSSVGNDLPVARLAVRLVRCADISLLDAVIIGAKEQLWLAVQEFQGPTG